MSISIILIVITVLISLKGIQDKSFLSNWSYSPYLVKHHKENSRIFKHLFVHADYNHLLFNMLSFYFFGPMLENELYAMYGNAGLIHFVLIYFAGGFAATIWPFIRNHDNDLYFSVGASGAVSAIIFAAIIWNPTMEMMLIFLPIPIKAYIFGPLLLLFEYFSMKYSKSNIAHDAHIGGAIFGIIYILIINIDKGKEFLTTIFQ